MSRFASGCICGKFMIFDDTCHWCGRGLCSTPTARRSPRLRRLPRDLGAFQREGRRPDPHLENVIRLDRLRERWKVPPVRMVQAEVTLTDREARVLALVAMGLPYRTIGAWLGISEATVQRVIRDVFSAKLGCSRSEAIEWWWAQTEPEGVAA